MKVFFDTNVYVAEALLGGAAEAMLSATQNAKWRIFSSEYVAEETVRVLLEKFDCSRRFCQLTRHRIRLRAKLIGESGSRHKVPQDPADNPILQAAVSSGVDLLVTNDAHLLSLSPYEGLKIVSMTDYFELLVHEGLLPSS